MTHRNAEARLPNAFLTKTDADAKAFRAFWRGLSVGVLSQVVIMCIFVVLT